MAVPIPTEVFGRFDRLAFLSRRTARAGIGGEHRSRRASPSTDYVDFRAYQPGDDFRRVDWNVYARLGSLQVKLTEGRERLDVLLMLDCSSSMDYGSTSKLTFATQVVAALAYVGMARADSVRIVCLGRAARFGPFGRRSRLHALVRELSAIAPAGLVDLNTALSDLGTGSLCVVVSDLLTPDGISDGLDALRHRGADVVVVHVVSPEEAEPRVAGEVELLDSETGERLEVGVSLLTLAAYRDGFQAWLAAREAECLGRGMRYVRVRSDRPLPAVILEDMRRTGVLR